MGFRIIERDSFGNVTGIERDFDELSSPDGQVNDCVRCGAGQVGDTAEHIKRLTEEAVEERS